MSKPFNKRQECTLDKDNQTIHKLKLDKIFQNYCDLNSNRHLEKTKKNNEHFYQKQRFIIILNNLLLQIKNFNYKLYFQRYHSKTIKKHLKKEKQYKKMTQKNQQPIDQNEDDNACLFKTNPKTQLRLVYLPLFTKNLNISKQDQVNFSRKSRRVLE